MKLRITKSARADLRESLHWSARNFGQSAARRYKELLEVSIFEIAEDSSRSGARDLENLPGVKLYHIRHSRKRATVESLLVKRPRHFLAYRVAETDTVELLRILHNSMDVEARLQEE